MGRYCSFGGASLVGCTVPFIFGASRGGFTNSFGVQYGIGPETKFFFFFLFLLASLVGGRREVGCRALKSNVEENILTLLTSDNSEVEHTL